MNEWWCFPCNFIHFQLCLLTPDSWANLLPFFKPPLKDKLYSPDSSCMRAVAFAEGFQVPISCLAHHSPPPTSLPEKSENDSLYGSPHPLGGTQYSPIDRGVKWRTTEGLCLKSTFLCNGVDGHTEKNNKPQWPECCSSHLPWSLAQKSVSLHNCLAPSQGTGILHGEGPSLWVFYLQETYTAPGELK